MMLVVINYSSPHATPIERSVWTRDFQVHPSSLCCVFSVVFVCVDKSRPVYNHKLFRVCGTRCMRWIQAPPLFMFSTLLLIFLHQLYDVIVVEREVGGGCFCGWGCHCTPTYGVSGLGPPGSGKGGELADRCKRINCSERGELPWLWGETDEWVTSQWRGGERVWNWFGGRARGGVPGWVFV